MKFNIRGENLEVTGAIREYVEKKISKLKTDILIHPQHLRYMLI